MEDKIVYVPVSVEDELPELFKQVPTINIDNEFGQRTRFSSSTDEQYKSVLKHSGISHWLKPTPLSELLKEKNEQISGFIDWLVENNKLDSITAKVIKQYIPIKYDHKSQTTNRYKPD